MSSGQSTNHRLALRRTALDASADHIGLAVDKLTMGHFILVLAIILRFLGSHSGDA